MTKRKRTNDPLDRIAPELFDTAEYAPLPADTPAAALMAHLTNGGTLAEAREAGLVRAVIAAWLRERRKGGKRHGKKS